MMPEVLKLSFHPTGPDAEASTKIVIDIGWVAICLWKFEMTAKTTGKKTHTHTHVGRGRCALREQNEQRGEIGRKEEKSYK